jgi:transcriptional regulator
MYVPEHFRESRIDALQALIRRHPLAVLIANTDSGLSADHIPMQLRAGSGWQLRGHVARANPLWGRLAAGSQILAIFRGAEHYVSPSWYASKAEHGMVVPTWNYAAVHVTGSIRFIEDPAWLLALVESLTDAHEQGRADRWHVTDAPADYRDGRLRAIVGFEIAVTSIIGKFKSSQNRPAADRAGVVRGLRADGVTDEDMTELVREPPP